MSKEPTRHQLSSRLAYQAKTPAFLLRLQQQHGGGRRDYDDDEFEDDGSGRPPIPRRPAIPERPDDDPGSAGEDDEDEKPQVVVLKEGKHLTELEVENERRKGMIVCRLHLLLVEESSCLSAKGLSPLPEGPELSAEAGKPGAEPSKGTQSEGKKQAPQGLSFSSGVTAKGKNSKRKAVGDGRDDDHKPQPPPKGSKKKPKKQDKKLLSFGDEA
ncbi:hypothetical protein BN946_scf184298.g14 [Trametes cinnabarina]|uniref:DUF4604 domain-containing protein n=1 Tax=Pycnoporus cinnabarinus TaxID=5643 RepID=A0A060SR07_PYCCI|nr:hypothetical protein BN946_scf184298.g14 [Trametes cinnabarina]